MLRGDKYIVGTWLMETQRTDSEQVFAAIRQMWELSGKTPPSRTAVVGRKSSSKLAAKSAGKTAAAKRKKRKR